MSQALWLLLRLQLGGWIRYLGVNLRTIRGALLALVGLAVFVPWLFAVLIGSNSGNGIEPTNMLRYGPAGLILYCILNVLFSSHERAIYFTPAEIQFLFAGPFGRKQILGYKLILTLLVGAPAVVFMGLIFRVRHGWWPTTFLGTLFLFVFMQLFTMSLGLLANTLGEKLYARSRVLTLVLLGVVLVAGLFQAWRIAPTGELREVGDAILDTTAWNLLTYPLRAFFEVMLATHLSTDLFRALGVSLLVLGGLVVLIFTLDAEYLESTAASSARIYARIQQMRGRQVSVEEVGAPGKSPRWSLPDFPFWGGIGPIFWRQLTSGMRGLGRVLILLGVLGAVLFFPLLSSSGKAREVVLPSLIGLGVWMSIFLTTVIPFDFRGDIDRIAVLKTLPVVPWRIVVGQILTPTLILLVLQLMALGAILLIAPEYWKSIVAVAIYVPPFCFFLVALDNLLFLLFPVRIMAATPGDFQAMGRNVLLAVGKMLALGIVGGMAALVGVLAWLITQRVEVGVVAGWPIVVTAGGLLVPLNSLAFSWFDVGRDTPA